MRIAVCEDEKFYSEKLISSLTSYFDNHNLTCEISLFDDEPLLDESFELIFLDIALKGCDGVEIARSLRSKGITTPVIFVTSMKERVFEGYDVGAFDFIVKDTMDEKLGRVLDRFFSVFNSFIVVDTKENSKTKIRVSDIIYIEPDGRGSIICTKDETILSSDTVSSISKNLNTGFVECYKSIFVKTDNIKRVDSDSLTLINQKNLPVSRRNRKNVLSAVMSEVKKR